MPGLNFVQCYDANNPSLEKSVKNGMAAIYCLPWHNFATLCQNASCILTCQSYEGYPIFSIQTQRYDFLLEGYWYEIPPNGWAQELLALASHLFDTSHDSHWLRRWVFKTDGEFVVWVHDKQTHCTALINDAFGRLPVYYHQNREGVVVSRNIRFVHAQLKNSIIDRLSLAHFLLLGHTLAEKTVFKGIHLLSSGTCLLVQPHHRALKIHRMVTFDFSRLSNRHLSRQKNAAILGDLFKASCKARSGRGSRDIVSLSGGLDSRAVAAGLAALRIPPIAATFFCPGYTSQEEVRIARQVAQCLKIPWELENLSNLRSKDALELLKLKSGLSPLYMGFILSFFRALRLKHGPGVTYFTGDGGDQCLPMLRPSVFFPHKASLGDAILQEHWVSGRRLGLTQVAQLTGLTRRALWQSLIDDLMELPERTWTGKWLHYQFYATIVKIYFEAEDRNRSYFWSTSPFYGNSFFMHAINCPQRQKAGFALYRHFLERLSPAVSPVAYSGYDGPLGSPSFWLNRCKKEMIALRPTWTLGVKKWLQKAEMYYPEAAVVRFLRLQTERIPGIEELLDVARLKVLTRTSAALEVGMINTIFNTLALLEDFLMRQSSLETAPDMLLAQQWIQDI